MSPERVAYNKGAVGLTVFSFNEKNLTGVHPGRGVMVALECREPVREGVGGR